MISSDMKQTFSKSSVFVTAIVYAQFTLFVFRDWLRFNNLDSEPLPNVKYEDSIYYLGQIREILANNYSIGNPLIIEHANDGISYGNSSLFFIWGLIGDLFNFNTIQTFLVMISITSGLLFLTSYFFLNIFFKSVFSLFSSVFFCFFLVGPLGRPSPTQQLLPFLILGVALIIKMSNTPRIKMKRTFSIAYIFTTVLLVSGNPLYSLVMLFFVVGLFVYFRDFGPWLTFFTVVVNFAYFLWNKLYFSDLDNLVGLRFGVHATHLPGAVRITAPLIILCILLFFINARIQLRKQHIEAKTLFILCLSLLGVTNSQIVTGKAYEMEAHFALFYYFVIVLSVSWLFKTFLKYDTSRISNQLNKVVDFLPLIPVCVLIWGFFQFPAINTFESKTSRFIQELNDSEKEKVVLVKDDSDLGYVNDKIIYLTSKYLYWDPYATASRTKQTEILSRFACFQDETLSYEDFLTKESNLYFHQYSNPRLKAQQLNNFLGYFGLKIKQNLSSEYLRSDYRVYLREKQLCKNGVYKFRVDLIEE